MSMRVRVCMRLDFCWWAFTCVMQSCARPARLGDCRRTHSDHQMGKSCQVIIRIVASMTIEAAASSDFWGSLSWQVPKGGY